MMPSFIIVGAQKSGTTAMFEYLAQHPAVSPPCKKEIYFFERFYDHGVRWYQSHFPISYSKNQITGEASPFYLAHPLAPERVAEVIPDSKIIILLRDPIERAWSQYKQNKKVGREPLSFKEAIHAETERLGNLQLDSVGKVPLDYFFYSYAEKGFYADQIERWFAKIPREQFLILDANIFFKSTKSEYDKTLDFLGLTTFEGADFKPVNALKRESEIDTETQKYLRDLFEPHNQRLSKLLGTEMSWC